MHVRSLQNISSLEEVEFRVSSQWGEDGIIDWLVERAQIPPHLQTFVEFGVEDYTESNTRFLLQNRNWRGLVLEGSESDMHALRKQTRIFWAHDLTAKHAFITRENINDLLSGAGFSGEIGLLSIDLDGNDYWVWQAITAVRPVFCVCEYNAVFGDVWPITVPYDPAFVRNKPEYRNLYFGASILALRSLAADLGYQFLGTNSAGVNAFFVRKDYAPRVVPMISGPRSYPSRFRESKDESGQLLFERGFRRADLIRQFPVVDTKTQETRALGTFQPLYSDDWLGILEAGAGPTRHETSK